MSIPHVVLLVDDHADTLQVLAKLLRRHDYQVLLASDCESARETAVANHFDFIVSDLSFPDGSGLILLSQLREIRNVPAIALTGYGMREDIQRSQSAGFDRHLTKPVDFSVLISSIAALLVRSPTNTTSPWRSNFVLASDANGHLVYLE